MTKIDRAAIEAAYYHVEGIEAGAAALAAAVSQEYNGWANRETWALVLHLDNDEGLYEGALDVVRAEVKDHLTSRLGKRDCYSPLAEHRIVGEQVKDYAEGLFTVDGYIEEFGGDHLPAALSRIAEDIGSLYRVDWDEVGAHYLQTLSETEES